MRSSTRLRAKLAQVDGIQTFLFSAQDLRGGGRQGGSQYQYALVDARISAQCGTGRWRWRKN